MLELYLDPEVPGGELPAELTVWLRTGDDVQPWGVSAPVLNGVVRFAELAPGVYSLRRPVGGVPLLRAQGIRIRAGETTTVTLAWPVVHTLSGKVTDDQGRPLPDAGIGVRAWPPDDRTAIQYAATDQEGEFVLSGLPRGRYEVEIKQDKGEEHYPEGVWDLNVDGDGARDTGLAFVLPTGLAVRGRVITPDGEPIGDVFITGRSCPMGPKPWPKPYLVALRETESDDNGRFELTGLPKGMCLVSVWYSDSYSQPPDVAVPVEAGGLEVTLTIRPPPPATVSGVVRDEAGNPLPGTQVEARWGALGYGRCWQGAEHRCRTGDDGSFSLPARRQRWPLILVNREGYLPWSCDRRPPDAPEGTATLTIVLRRGHRISGTVVRAADGRPAVGTLVLPVLPESNGVLWASELDTEGKQIQPADGEGRFSLGGVPRGQITLELHSGTSSGAENTGSGPLGQRVVTVGDVDLDSVRIVVPATGTVRGRALDRGGRPLGHGCAELLPLDVDQTPAVAVRRFPQADGRFGWDQVPVGRYLGLWNSFGRDGQSSPMPIEITVGAGATVEVEFVVGPSPDDPVVDGVLVGHGLTIEGGEIRFWPWSPRWRRWAQDVVLGDPAEAEIGADSRFRIHGLQPGTYAFVYGLMNWAIEPDGIAAQGSGTVELRVGQKELRLEVEAVDVSGAVTSAFGVPVADAGGSLMPASATGLAVRDVERNAKTDAHGRYLFHGVRPGEYHLHAWFRYPDTGEEESGILRHLAVTAVANRFDLALEPRAQLSGHATDEAGLPLAGVGIVVLQWSDSGWLSAEVTWADGAYVFEDPLDAREACPVYALAEGYATEAAMLRLADRVRHDVRLVPGGDMLVTVRRQGQPVLGQVVQVFDATGAQVLRESRAGKVIGNRVGSVLTQRCSLLPTDIDGRTVVRGLRPGRYTLRLPGRAESATVEVKAMAQAEASIELAAGE